MRLRSLVPFAAAFLSVLVIVPPAGAQTRTRKPAPRSSPPATTRPVQAPPEVACPAVLGVGVTTHREFCDVQVGRDPQTGIVLKFPPHRGPLTLRFDLHNRVTYSEQLVRERRAYARQVATIGVLTLDGRLITRAVAETEFRTAKDLLDRVGGGAGPGGVKAVAPVGSEPIEVEIPEGVDAVSILGEKLLEVDADGTATIVTPGRPIAIISDVMIEYRAAPAAKKPAAKKPPSKPRRK